MTLQEGWLNRQLDAVRDDIEQWPEWMKREAIFASEERDDVRERETAIQTASEDSD